MLYIYIIIIEINVDNILNKCEHFKISTQYVICINLFSSILRRRVIKENY